MPQFRKQLPGDLLLYWKGEEFTHVAVVVEHHPDFESGKFRTRVVSQWGADGEYLHNVDDVPYWLGKPKEFWSERKR